jgi:hypothetical protein
MYGKLRIPLGEQATVVIPTEAVRRVGQLETVRVKEDGHWRSVAIRTGRILEGRTEVLAGLQGDEILGWGD